MSRRKGLLKLAKSRKATAKAKAKGLLPKRSDGIPGPSDNPATNYLVADIAIRAGGYIARRSLERGLLSNRYGKETAHAIVKNKTLGQSVASWVFARVATKSLPGAVIVGGGALAKTLYDRRKSRRQARNEGDRELLDQAKGE